jgi:hypothetical protein
LFVCVAWDWCVFSSAYALLNAQSDDFCWYVIAPRIKKVRKFIVKPAADFLQAMVQEFWSDEVEEGTVDEPKVIDGVCVCVCVRACVH